MTADSQSLNPVRRDSRIRKWRRVQAFGGFALACSFFLPAVRACNSDYIPAEEVWNSLRYPADDIGEWAAQFCVNIAAYLFGALTMVASLRARKSAAAVKRREGISIAVVLGAVALISLIGVACELRDPSPMDLWGAFFVAATLISCAYWLRGIRMGPGGLFAMRWYMALACAVWFSLWLFGGDSLYGLWISLAGTMAILVGSTKEAILRTRRGLWPTVCALLTARLQLYDTGEPRCWGCGYLLKGLTTPRCPECGQPFSPEDYREAPTFTGSSTVPRGD